MLADPALRSGAWQLCETAGWEDNQSHRRLVAWTWTGERRWLIAVNLDDSTAAATIRTPWTDLGGTSCTLTDPTRHISFSRSGNDLTNGLFVELAGRDWHLFRVQRGEEVQVQPAAVTAPAVRKERVTASANPRR